MKITSTSQFVLILLSAICWICPGFKTVEACTVFMKSNGETVLFGNVENEQSHYVVELHFNPPNETLGLFGNFHIFYNGNIGGGMNDQGLCFDVAGLPDHEMSTNKPYGDLMNYLLTKCATVHDAIAFFNSNAWYGHRFNHLMVTDKTGASVVIEHIGNSIYTYFKSGNSQVMTNYSFTDPEIRYGDYPCDRFNTATEMLDSASINVDNFQHITEEVAHAYYSALYATIYNPNTLDIHVFNPNKKGSERTTFKLVDEFAKGSHHYLLKDHEIILGTTDMEHNKFSISENSPNPFSIQTSFSLNLSVDAEVNISILDMNGREIDVLENRRMIPGTYTFNWLSEGLPSGLYFCRIRIDAIVETRKWIKN